MTRRWLLAAVLLAVGWHSGTATGDAPVPLGTSTLTVSYPDGTPTGVVATGDRNYSGSLPGVPLLGAANISAFNSLNDFGRRKALTVNPAYAHVLGPDEVVIAHAFFKNPGQRGQEFFPGLLQGGSITMEIHNIQFDRPVTVEEDTLLFHVLWDANQNLALGGGFEEAYRELNDHYTITPTYRDFGTFVDGGIFKNNPPNYVLDSSDVDVNITYNTSSNFDLRVTVPYALFRNLEDVGQFTPGPGLPAPQGFLEPFHFHLEYVVTPEPATLALLLPGVLTIIRRKTRR